MVSDWQRSANERARKFGDMQARVQQIAITDSSSDGAVRVTVGSNGLLQDLQKWIGKETMLNSEWRGVQRLS